MDWVSTPGTEVSPRVRAAAVAFGATGAPVPLPGGMGGTWRAGDLVLKPAGRADLAIGLAELAEQIPPTKRVRIQKPLRSIAGAWTEHGYCAFQYLAGTEAPGRYAEKLDACDAFSEACAQLARPAFFDERNDPWARADRAAWGESEETLARVFGQWIDPLRDHLRRLALPSQIIHADITGNLIFADPLPVGVIDITPYWRPAAFAKAVLAIDAIAWHGAPVEDFQRLFADPSMPQLLLRASLRRMLEQPGQVRDFDKPLEDALSVVRRQSETLRILGLV